MKVVRVDYKNDTIIIYLKDVIKDDLKSLSYVVSSKLNKYYNIDLKGFYNVNAYMDNNYGTILEYINDSRDYIFLHSSSLLVFTFSSFFNSRA